MERSKRRVGLKTRMNLMIAISILVVSVGLTAIAYHNYCDSVDEFYHNRMEHAARALADEFVDGDFIAELWQAIDTDAFRQVRARAMEAGDEKIIQDWMLEQPSASTLAEDLYASVPKTRDTGDRKNSLYADYVVQRAYVEDIKVFYDIKEASVQYDVDGATYNLIDPQEDLFCLGTVEERIDALSGYGDNDRMPPTMYHSSFGWLMTACEPIYSAHNPDKVVGLAVVDIDMNDVMRKRHEFLIGSALFSLLLIAAVMTVSMWHTRRTVTEPLAQLARSTTDFAKDDGDLTGADVVDLPISNNDEIGDLYHEIQSMQRRIVDYTDNLARVTAEKERVSTELRTAAAIQESVLPSAFPAFPLRHEFDLYASMDPAKEVGGDFYDFFLIDDDHLAVVIADVTDKGVPAALFMMSAKILIDYRARLGGTPGQILADVNAQLCENNESGMFVTVWMGILDLRSGVMTCANAGHEYPAVRAGGAFRILTDRHGLPLGVMPGMKYRDYSIRLKPGDAVFVYTDGVPEANNADGELYTLARMELALNRIAGRDPKRVLEGVRADVDAFVRGANQFDDLTMLCVTYLGDSPADLKRDKEDSV